MIDGRAKRGAGSEVEGKRNRREDALMVDGKRGVGRFVERERAERNELAGVRGNIDRKSTRLNSSHGYISYAAFCLKKKNPSSSKALPPTPPHPTNLSAS